MSVVIHLLPLLLSYWLFYNFFLLNSNTEKWFGFILKLTSVAISFRQQNYWLLYLVRRTKLNISGRPGETGENTYFTVMKTIPLLISARNFGQSFRLWFSVWGLSSFIPLHFHVNWLLSVISCLFDCLPSSSTTNYKIKFWCTSAVFCLLL